MEIQSGESGLPVGAGVRGVLRRVAGYQYVKEGKFTICFLFFVNMMLGCTVLLNAKKRSSCLMLSRY